MLRIDFEPSDDLYPFESKWFDSQVGPLHCIDEGDGQPLLLLHGNPTWSFLYRDIVRDLREDFRCIAVDYPGFGLSVHPDDYDYTPAEHARVVGSLVDHLELDDFLLMGQDWGGPIGMRVAVERAERVGGICAGNTWFWPFERVMSRLFGWGMSTELMQWAILEKNFFVEKMIPMGTTTELSAEVMDHYRAVQSSPEARRGVAEFPRQLLIAADWLEELESDVRETLSELPVLLTWGVRDFAFPVKPFVPRWREAFDDVELVRLENAKHFIQEDAPHRIARAISERFAG